MKAKVVVLFAGLALVALLEPAVSRAAPPDEEAPRRFALPSDTGHYLGYQVGGGAGHPLKAEPRRADEGTWGWDYQGWLIPRRVNLGWWHGRRSQGGV